MMENVKVLLWGFGAMGSGMAKMLLGKKGVEIVGVCDIDPNKKDKSMFEVLGISREDHPEVLISDDIDELIGKVHADVALLCTDSFTKNAYPKIIKLVEAKMNVVSTAEEMAYPMATSPDLSEQIHKAAKENKVTVLGTGINPGLMMDLLAVVLTGACEEVHEVECERVNNLSPFGPLVMEEQGVGLTQDDFNRKSEDGTLAGHVGFAESIKMICDAIGWDLKNPITQSQEPIVSSVYRKAPFAEVEAGNVAGVRMLGHGMIEGEKKISMIHPQQVEPQLEGVHTGDYIRIKGVPNIDMAITPEVPGGIGTIAMCVNMIPHVINARSGLKTMLDLPVPRAIMGDMRDLIDLDD